jgi:hypothetical protein
MKKQMKILAKIIVLIMALNLLFSIYKLNIVKADSGFSIVEGSNSEETIWLTLRQVYGYTEIATAAIMGNLYHESGLRSNNAENYYVGNNTSGTYDRDIAYTNIMNNDRNRFCDKDIAKNGETNGSLELNGIARNGYVGYGLAQWTYYSRKAVLWDMAHEAGVCIDNIGIQLKVLNYELTTGYIGVKNEMQATSDITVATAAFLRGYEKPADQSDAAVERRTNTSITYYNKYSGQQIGGNPSTVTPIETICNEIAVIKQDDTPMFSNYEDAQTRTYTLVKGQVVTRINNSDNYTANGVTYDGIKLANGKTGFVARDRVDTTEWDNVYKIVTTSGLGVNVRESKSSSSARVTGVDENGLVSVQVYATELENGYFWDYIVAPDGIKGYVARKFLVKVENSNLTPTTPTPPPEEPPVTSNEFFQVTETTIKMVPSVTYEKLKETYEVDVIVKTDDNIKDVKFELKVEKTYDDLLEEIIKE